MGAVKVLLLSEALDTVRVTVKCGSCDYNRKESINRRDVSSLEESLSKKQCLKCNSPSLSVEKAEDVVEELAEAAMQANAEVEMMSVDTEEGQMLKNAFGGIAATLRFKL
jgi:peptide chain release factor subunit 1